MKVKYVELHPLDRDFLQTEENFFFCIVGYVHPPDRVLSYLKYIPRDSGKWMLDKQALQRVLPYYSAQAVLNTFEFLKKKYSKYIFFDKQTNLEFSAVPYPHIKQYFSTQEKLREIFSIEKLDPLQKKLISFVRKLSELSGVSKEAFGVTGSILLDIHNPKFSDLDVTVHGLESSIILKKTMREILGVRTGEIRQLDEKDAKRWQKDKVERFGISQKDAEALFMRKWNMGLYQNTRFSIHPIRNLNEINEKYGDKEFIQMGDVKVRAEITDDSEGLFLPSKYKVTDVDVLEGRKIDDIQEIISYEGLFDAVAEMGEIINANGRLELVKEKGRGKKYYRVVIGSRKGKSQEFISVVK
jgi:predicted nucleotidyltransferase